MPNDWINDKPKDARWLDKTPQKDDALKTLQELGDDRQKASEAPKPATPAITPPPPVEEIPYDRVASSLESASTEVLGAVARVEKAIIDLRKISVVVPGNGEKGKLLLNEAIGYQSRLEGKSSELKKLSEEIAEYKNSLPKETVTQI